MLKRREQATSVLSNLGAVWTYPVPWYLLIGNFLRQTEGSFSRMRLVTSISIIKIGLIQRIATNKRENFFETLGSNT
jgi:hypothetical protein